MKAVLVTGGAGFIGSHTVDLLLARGYRVRVLDSLQERVHPHGWPPYIPASVDRVQGDVRNQRDWEKALDGVEAVIHLAAYHDYMLDFRTFFCKGRIIGIQRITLFVKLFGADIRNGLLQRRVTRLGFDQEIPQ